MTTTEEPKKEEGKPDMKKMTAGAATIFALGMAAGVGTAKVGDTATAAKAEVQDSGCSKPGQGCQVTCATMEKGKAPVYRTVRVGFDGKVRADGTSTVLKSKAPDAFSKYMDDFKTGKFDGLCTVN